MLYSPPLTYYCTFTQTEVLPKSQQYNSSMFLTTTPSSHLLQGHVTILQNFLRSPPARKQLPSQGYMVKPSLHLSGPHDQSSPTEMLVMCVSSRPRAPRNGWPLPSALAPFGLDRGIWGLRKLGLQMKESGLLHCHVKESPPAHQNTPHWTVMGIRNNFL